MSTHIAHAATNNPAMNILLLVPFWTCKEFLYYLRKGLLDYRVWVYLMCPSNASLLSRSGKTSLAADFYITDICNYLDF